MSGSGISNIVSAIAAALKGNGNSSGGSGGGIIPFHEAARYFNPAPLTYIAGAILAAAIDTLRGFNLLL